MLTAIISASFLLSVQTADSKDVTVEQKQAVVVEEIKPKKLITESELKELAYASADKYEVSREKVFRTSRCEAKKVTVDGEILFDTTAKSDWPGENSYGVAQWNLDSGNTGFDGKVVTKAQAIDAVYSLNLMAYYFAKGKSHKWTCYRNIYT